MSCNRADLACKPFAASPTVTGAGKEACDKYFSNQCAHFQELMHGLKTPNPCGCFGPAAHREYICPQVGHGNPLLGAPNTPTGRDCFNQPPGNLGELSICRRDSLAGSAFLPASYDAYSSYARVPRQTGGGPTRSSKQTGGAFSVFPSALDVDINDPVYNRCETVVHLKPSFLDGPVYGNLADTCGLRTNYRPSKQPGLDVSLVRGPGPQTGPLMQTSLCGDRQRCGNGACAPTQNPTLDDKLTGCKTVNLPKSCNWDDRVLTSPWVYGLATSDIPTFYYDLSGETVGARPQFRAGTNNSIPPMMLINQTNLLGRQFGCRQPCWQTNCL